MVRSVALLEVSCVLGQAKKIRSHEHTYFQGSSLFRVNRKYSSSDGFTVGTFMSHSLGFLGHLHGMDYLGHLHCVVFLMHALLNVVLHMVLCIVCLISILCILCMLIRMGILVLWWAGGKSSSAMSACEHRWPHFVGLTWGSLALPFTSWLFLVYWLCSRCLRSTLFSHLHIKYDSEGWTWINYRLTID